jgi:YesN/AraC family two-component response regulator
VEDIYSKKENTFFLSGDAYVFSVCTVDNIMYEEHTHKFVEMVYMLRGKCVHTIDGVDYPVGHGDLVIINYNQTHSIRGDVGGEYVNILIKPEYINKSLANKENAFELLNLSEFESFRKILDENQRKVRFAGEERNQIERIIRLIMDELNQKHPGYEIAERSQMNLLIIMIFRQMSFKFETRFDGISDKLLTYISANCAQRLTLSGVAQMCAYNSSYFSRIFKMHTGMNFTAYLRKIRIEKAENLLLSTDNRVLDIMYDVGYTDPTRFFEDFKTLNGMTPLKFRKSKK